MTIIRMRDVGKFGVITDIDAAMLPPEAWSSGQNIRFIAKQAERTRGCIDSYNTPNVDPFFVMSWEYSDVPFWVYASATKVRRTDGTTDIDITRTSGGDYAAGALPLWNGGVIGGVPVLNNGVDEPLQS